MAKSSRCLLAAIAAVAFLALAGLGAFLLPRNSSSPRDWTVAEKAWLAYAADLATTDRAAPFRSVRFTSPELKRLLPAHRFYVTASRESGVEGTDILYAVSADGQIARLGDGRWPQEADARFDSSNLASFLAQSGIVIGGAQDAADLVKIIDQIAFAHSSARARPDKSEFVCDFPGRAWKYMAFWNANEWIAARIYTGQAESVGLVIKLHVDEAGRATRVLGSSEALLRELGWQPWVGQAPAKPIS